jgi:hypothetical protein
MALIHLPIFIAFYFRWHYSRALLDYLHVWAVFIWYVGYLFSIPNMVQSLFSPLRRLGEEYPSRKMFTLGPFLEVLIVNVIMRIVGAIVRLGILVTAALSFAIVALGGIVGFFLWLALPAVLPVAFAQGFLLVLSG